MDASTITALQTYLDQTRAEADIPGLCAAVALDDAPVWRHASGVADVASGRRLEVDARFYVYSISKSFLAALLARLSAESRIDLDGRLGRWLPQAPLADEVSLRMLLQHTAGLPDYGALPSYNRCLRSHPRRPWTEAEFIANTWHGQPDFPPGSSWGYSNLGYLLLRRVAEMASGVDFATAVAREVVGPLRLTQTAAVTTLAEAASLTPGYSRIFDGAKREEIRHRYHPGWVAHGVLASTAGDVARFYHRLLGGALLDPAHTAAMTALVPVPGEHPPAVQPSYGLGLIADPAAEHGALYGHGGGGPGYAAFAGHRPDASGHRLTVVVLANSDAVDPWSIAEGCVPLVLDGA